MRSSGMARRLLIIPTFVTVLSVLATRAQTGCLTGSVIDNAGQPVKGIRITVGDNVWTTAQIFPEPHSYGQPNSGSRAFLPENTQRMHLTISLVIRESGGRCEMYPSRPPLSVRTSSSMCARAPQS